jgi:hypothetical protein
MLSALVFFHNYKTLFKKQFQIKKGSTPSAEKESNVILIRSKIIIK